MSKIIKKQKKIGSSPGTLIHIGEIYKSEVELKLIEYSKDEYKVINIKDIDNFFDKKKKSDLDLDPTNVCWLNVEGLHNISLIEKLGSHFNLHPLVLEDILNTGHRIKIDDFDDYIFIILKMIHFDEKTNELSSKQLSLVLIDNYILSFQELDSEIFNGVKQRIESGKGNIRKLGPDYLLYALVDTVVDSYFVVLEKLGDKIDELEDSLMENPKKESLQNIHTLKKEMLFLRNSIWPLREVISILVRAENSHIKAETVVYLRDVYDHIIQVIDTIEIYRDMLSGMLDTYLSSISNRTNDVMKVLTILSTIFIPITFLAGVYGMNFKFMPELDWRLGYGMFWLIAIVSTLLMINFFKKKKWL